MADHMTVVRPRPSGKGAVGLGVGLVVVALLGDLLELLAFVIVPLGRVPAVRRWLDGDDAAPDQLEVRDDRVTAAGGRVIHRVDGAVLTVRDADGEPVLYVAGTFDATATIDLARYDVDEVSRAVLAHGWPWQPAGGAVTYPEKRRGREDPLAYSVVLRDGWTRPVPAKAITAVVLAGVGLALVGYFAGFLAGLRGVQLFLVVPAFAVLIALCVIAVALVWHRKSRLTFALDDDRIEVSYGAISKLVVTRRSVVSARVGRRWVRIEEDGKRRATWLPVAPRRRELLTALTTHGWPVHDDT